MTEAGRRFGETLVRRARGEDAPAAAAAIPPELLERAGAAMAELQAVLGELAALGAGEEPEAGGRA